MDFPRPMLNSPANTGAEAANNFYQEVLRRVDVSNESRKVVLKWACEPWKNYEGPDYAEIVKPINLWIREIRPNMTAAQHAEMIHTLKKVSITNIDTILLKLRAIVSDVH